MELIKRHNILEMIGGDRRRYHSAIITSFSFDFNFFENRIMPYFAAANIKNVNLFLDGVQLDTTLQHSSGQENMATRSYARNPIYSKGAFHPKIMMLVGKKHGLIIIGSGNLTSSGLNTNEEIWAAFHMDNLGSKNMPVFSSVWNYLQSYSNQIRGFNKEQFQWIRTYTPWINELNNEDVSWNDNGIEVTTIYNDAYKNTSSFDRLLELLPKGKKLESLNIVSPYFDINGAFVTELKERLDVKHTNLLIDKNSELLPTNMDVDAHPEINLFDWADCVDSFNDSNRLHAKMIQFKYADEEVMYIGSANATQGAWINNSNDEFGIVFKRQRKGNYFDELGISVPPIEKALVLKELSPNKNITGTKYEKRYRTRILKAEINGQKLTLYFHSSLNETLELQVLNRWNEVVELSQITFENLEEYSIQLNSTDCFKVALFKTNEQISNYALIHQIEQQLRCNPDPNREKFELALDNAYNNPSDIASLLEYSTFDWADDEGDDIQISEKGSGISIANKKIDQNQNYKKLTEQEFNAVSEEVLLRQRSLLESSNVRIAEFLHHYSKGMIAKDEEITESSEQAMMDSMDGDGDIEIVQSFDAKKQYDDDVKNKWALHNYIKRQYIKYQKPLIPYLESSIITDLKTKPTNLKSVSSMLISFQLIDIFSKKKLSNNITNSTENFFETDSSNNRKSIKGFLVNNYGCFLINSMAGFKSYDSELVQNKIYESRKQLGIKALIYILNTYWKSSELKVRDCLLLDTLLCLIPDDKLNNIPVVISEEAKNVTLSKTTFDRNVSELLNVLLPKYQGWIDTFNSDKSLLIKGIQGIDTQSIIYRKRHGFAVIQGITKNSNGFSLRLSKAGFTFNDESNLPKVANNQFKSKVLVY